MPHIQCDGCHPGALVNIAKQRHVSHSELQTWNVCHRQWYYAYVLRMRLAHEEPFIRHGLLMHKVAEHWANSGDEGDLAELAKKLCPEDLDPGPTLGTLPFLQEWFHEIYPRFKILGVEESRLTDLPEFKLKTVVDLRIQYLDDYVDTEILIDWKSTSRVADFPDKLAMEQQSLTYFVAYPDINILDFIVLRRGKKREPQIVRHRVHRNNDQIREFKYRLEYAIQEIAEERNFYEDYALSRESPPMANPTYWGCLKCPYQDVCVLEEQGTPKEADQLLLESGKYVHAPSGAIDLEEDGP